MKRIVASVTVRIAIAAALCLSFLTHFPLRASSAATVAHTVGEVKSESQYRNEAARYDGAIRTIAGIATMKLDSEADLRSAIAIFERERPNLKFYFSKLVVAGLGNSTFTSAVKRKLSTKEAATSVIKELTADRKKVQSVEGLDSLRAHLKRSTDADVAILRRVSDRLKAVADKAKSTGHLETAPSEIGQLKFVRAGFAPSEEINVVEPAPEAIIATILAVAYVVIIAIAVVSYGVAVAENASTEEGRDEVEECQDAADGRYERCKARSNVFEMIGCVAVHLAQLAACLAFP